MPTGRRTKSARLARKSRASRGRKDEVVIEITVWQDYHGDYQAGTNLPPDGSVTIYFAKGKPSPKKPHYVRWVARGLYPGQRLAIVNAMKVSPMNQPNYVIKPGSRASAVGHVALPPPSGGGYWNYHVMTIGPDGEKPVKLVARSPGSRSKPVFVDPVIVIHTDT